jgi:hypothetical protein
MIRFFQPSILGALLLAVFAGLLVPLYFEKPRFSVKQIQTQPQPQQQEDSARSVYDYKLANPDSNKFSEDWFELVSNDTVLEFLPSGFQKFRLRNIWPFGGSKPVCTYCSSGTRYPTRWR